MTILVTGGTGYIGAHTCVELIQYGYEIVIVDNFTNSKPEVTERIEKITGTRPVVHKLDVRDYDALDRVFKQHSEIDAVIHFAGLKAVGESVSHPLRYYDINVNGSITLLNVMAAHKVKTLVFSSSATVYGDPQQLPIPETSPLVPTNPYGRSKLMVEDILRDCYISNPQWRIGLLRYFNPVGAHTSGLIGEDPLDIPNNLMPIIAQVAIGRRESLQVFGNDYPTTDGTRIRDYLHVTDLASAHVRSLESLLKNTDGKLQTLNIGTGRGYSVLEMIKAFEKASGKQITYMVTDRRPGDIAICYADPSWAKEKIGWHAELGLERMCEDVWRWQSQNPNGL